MKSILFSNVKSILFKKYNVILYDWDADHDARKGRLVGKVSHRHGNDSLEPLDEEGVAELFAGSLATANEKM